MPRVVTDVRWRWWRIRDLFLGRTDLNYRPVREILRRSGHLQLRAAVRSRLVKPSREMI